MGNFRWGIFFSSFPGGEFLGPGGEFFSQAGIFFSGGEFMSFSRFNPFLNVFISFFFRLFLYLTIFQNVLKRISDFVFPITGNFT